jgi:hypothetical protein
MRVMDFGASPAPPLAYAPADVPHATVETNRTCDLGCRLCYNLDRVSTKTLEEVKAEVDSLLAKRKLQALSLLGGEPTLHPDLAAIIAHVKSRGVICQLLTNGRRFLSDEDGSYLGSLVRAGLDRIQVHIDRGQSPPSGDDIEGARRRLFARLESRRVHFGLSLTVYNEDRGRLAEEAKKYSRFRYFDGILAILAREPLPPRTQDVALEEECGGLRRGLGIGPSSYISSNVSREDVRWLLYLYFLSPAGGTALAVSPRLDKIVRKGYRLLTGREVFIIILPPALARAALGLTAAAECLLRPRSAFRVLGFALRSLGTGTRLQYIAVQDPPLLDEVTGRMVLCRGCPDATLRNGRLTPVCLADRMSPLPGFELLRSERSDWIPFVGAHLEGQL